MNHPKAKPPALPDELVELLPFIKESGEPFTSDELIAIGNILVRLDAGQRASVRNINAAAIAAHDAAHFLVVSGPGTGKSTLFISRIRHWLAKFPNAHIRVATFVRKLAHDLEEDIRNDGSLSDADKKRVEVSSLHRIARSILEQKHGTLAMPLGDHFRIIAEFWDELVWDDVLALTGTTPKSSFPWKVMEHALYDGAPPSDAPWQALREMHLQLQQFYNALGFPDLIFLATQAIGEEPALVADTLFIIDEFQDFNSAERDFIQALTARSSGLLLAGDDDQVLYDTLRRGHASIIRDYYQDTTFINGLLPYCSRCSVHICKTAEVFLGASSVEEEAISKLFLPLQEPTETKVVVAAATSPKVGVAYIERFLADHAERIRKRQAELEAGTAKDAYLLVLTPARALKFLGTAKKQLDDALRPFTPEQLEFGRDYWRVRDYYVLAKEPSQNFAIRKVLFHEDIDRDTTAALIRSALDAGENFADLNSEVIARALQRAREVREIVDSGADIGAIVAQLQTHMSVSDSTALASDLGRNPIGGHSETDDDSPVLDQGKGLTAVQIQTIVGSKGLSADNVIILGCDQANLQHVSRNAFFVALTRGRHSLALLACVGGGGAATLHEFVAALPDAHARALYLKANTQDELSTITDLQSKLVNWDQVKRASKGKTTAPKRKRNSAS